VALERTAREELDRMAEFIIGVDFGGTDLGYGVVTREGQVMASGSIPTHHTKGPEHAISRLRGALVALSTEHDIDIEKALGVGVGAPGPLNVETGKLYDPPNLEAKLWHGYPLRQELSRALQMDVEMDNDANAAAVGEHWAGVARGRSDFVLLTLGTGVGGGAFVNGTLLRGSTGVGAEMGHICVEASGLPCGCGSEGCLESYASSHGLARLARDIAQGVGHSEDDALRQACLDLVAEPEEVFGASALGCELAERIVRTYGRYLGVGIASLVNIFNPSLVVLSGGLSKYLELYRPHVEEQIEKRSFRLASEATEIRISTLGEHSGVVGAAAIFLYNRGQLSSPRPSVHLAERLRVLGLNIGASGTRAGVLEIRQHEQGFEVATLEESLHRGQGTKRDEVVAIATQAARQVLSRLDLDPAGLAGIGISTPGPLIRSRALVKNPPNMSWQEVYLREVLAPRTFGLPESAMVYADRDAHALTLAEKWFGKARLAEDFVCLYLGTGLGCGLVINGRLCLGAEGAAGEFGHFPIDFEGLKCTCNKIGCAEEYASGRALERYVRELLLEGAVSELRDSPRIYYLDVIDAADRGDEVALKAFDMLAGRLVVLVGGVIDALNPEMIVFSGSLARGASHFLPKVRELLPNWLIRHPRNPESLLVQTSLANVEVSAAAATFLDQHIEHLGGVQRGDAL